MLLRRLRPFTASPPTSPRVIGIDDWAYKKGQRYGTIVVDLERHRVLDLLPDRTTDTVAAWLKNQPTIEVVSQDRAGAYADAARQGAPQAQQVADRWHLLQNLTEAVQAVVERHYPHFRQMIQQAAQQEAGQESAHPEQTRQNVATAAPRSAVEQLRQARREHRQARCAEVLRLREQGDSIQSIARQLRMHRRLVRKYLRVGSVPPRTPYPRRPSQLDAYADYVAQRWHVGCRNGAQLWRELRQQGFTGSASRFRQWLAQYYRLTGQRGKRRRTKALSLPSPRQISWLLLDGSRTAEAKTKEWVERFRQQVPDVEIVAQLAREFGRLLREQRSSELAAWIDRAAHSPLASWAAGLRRDLSAVQAAFSLPWSQGQVEGQVNRLKMLRRQMYGRAGFSLLRSRVLSTTSPFTAVISKVA
jgi:transposase